MARVVQRRSNPPYLLILLVFLALIAGAVAAVFINKDTDDQRKAQQAAADNAILARPQDLNSAGVKDLYAKARQEPMGPSLVGLMNRDVRGLIERISGTEMTVEEALAKADKARNDAGDQGATLGLVALLEKAKNDLNAANSANTDLNTQVKNLNAKIAEQDKALAAKQKEMEDALADAGKKMEAKQAEVGGLSQTYTTNLDNANKEAAAKLSEKDADLQKSAQQIQDLRKQVSLKDERIAELLNKLSDQRPKPPGERMVARAAGKIIKSLPQENVVYVNLGAKDRVTVGLPFEVYSAATGVDPNGEGKAKIVVTNVMDTVAECRVQESKRTDPIVEGDLVANVAYDPIRTYSFVVEGDFDIDGNGKADPLGTQRIKEMINQYGGRVMDNISVDTDFVVMGEEPVPPPKPADSAPESTKQLYADKLKEIQAYQTIEASAKALQIPVLSTNRFLALVGHHIEVAAQP